jgi:tetratricopeptide (TPR) repeat protein
MQQLSKQFPNHPEVAVLYADALMLVHPRDWYETNGTEREGTAAIVDLLADIIRRFPKHPAALHYYIHMVEPSHHPEKARTAADRLMPLMPMVSHMVHMPSHIYIRTGDYQKGIEANKMAVNGYDTYQKIMNGWEGNRYLYFHHNVDMRGANASLMGNYAEAAKAYGLLLSQFRPSDSAFFGNLAFSNVVQFNTAQLYLLDVRFGRWQQLLQSKTPLTNRPYHRLLWAFGQGMALAKTGQPEAAEQQLSNIKALIKESSFYVRRPNRNRAIDVVPIAALLLEGTIRQVQQQPDSAAAYFEAAIKAEDALRYSEPEDWRLPARHFLAQLYLEQKAFAKAKAVLEADLKDHPNNFWALHGLYAILQGQGKSTEAAAWHKAHKPILSQGDGRLQGVLY